MKVITNPTDQDITIMFKGETHTVPAKDSVIKSDNVAAFWATIHGFLEIEDFVDKKSQDAPAKLEKVAEAPKAVAKKVATKVTTNKK